MLRERLETSWSSNTCSKSLFRGISCLEVFTLCAGEILENFGLQNEHDHGAKVNSFKPRADAINCLYFTFLPLYMIFSSIYKCEHCVVQLCQQKLWGSSHRQNCFSFSGTVCTQRWTHGPASPAEGELSGKRISGLRLQSLGGCCCRTPETTLLLLILKGQAVFTKETFPPQLNNTVLMINGFRSQGARVRRYWHTTHEPISNCCYLKQGVCVCVCALKWCFPSSKLESASEPR